jgi:hypothetical protein
MRFARLAAVALAVSAVLGVASPVAASPLKYFAYGSAQPRQAVGRFVLAHRGQFTVWMADTPDSSGVCYSSFEIDGRVSFYDIVEADDSPKTDASHAFRAGRHKVFVESSCVSWTLEVTKTA